MKYKLYPLLAFDCTLVKMYLSAGMAIESSPYKLPCQYDYKKDYCNKKYTE